MPHVKQHYCATSGHLSEQLKMVYSACQTSARDLPCTAWPVYPKSNCGQMVPLHPYSWWEPRTELQVILTFPLGMTYTITGTHGCLSCVQYQAETGPVGHGQELEEAWRAAQCYIRPQMPSRPQQTELWSTQHIIKTTDFSAARASLSQCLPCLL